MTDRLVIELQDRRLLGAVQSALALLARPRELMDDIGAFVESRAQLRFDTKVDPAGVPWPALAESTRASYAKRWPQGIPGSLLIRTNQLRGSLGRNAGPDWVDIGTSRATQGGAWQVGELHEWGTTRMPRRGLLVADPKTARLADDDVAGILDIVQDAIRAAFD